MIDGGRNSGAERARDGVVRGPEEELRSSASRVWSTARRQIDEGRDGGTARWSESPLNEGEGRRLMAKCREVEWKKRAERDRADRSTALRAVWGLLMKIVFLFFIIFLLQPRKVWKQTERRVYLAKFLDSSLIRGFISE